MAASALIYGPPTRPFWESLDHIVEYVTGSVVLIEFPKEFVYIRSNVPLNSVSDIWPEGTKDYLTGIEIPPADYREFWSFEPLNPTDGRYYTSHSRLIAPVGYPDEGFAALEVLTSGPFPTPIGPAPFTGGVNVVISQEGADSQSIAEAYYATLSTDDAPMYEFFHGIQEEDEAQIYRYGARVPGPFLTGIGPATSGTDPDHTWNVLAQIFVPDLSDPFGMIINLRHTKEVEIFRNSTNFQSGHNPVPAVKLRAYGRRSFTVDPATKRILPYLPPTSEGEPAPTLPPPKWEKTILLNPWPPIQNSNESLGKFNSRGFAAPGHPLP